MDGIAAVSLGDAAIAAVGLLMGVYEAWLARQRVRGGVHGWIAAGAFISAAYPVLMLLHYNLPHEHAVLLSKLEMACIVTVCHMAPFVSMGIARRRMPIPWQVFALSAVFWFAVIPTSWVIPDQIELREFILLDHPFARRVDTPLGIVGSVWALVMVLGSAFWLHRNSAGRETEVKGFLWGVTLWTLTAAVDAALGATGAAIPMSLFEYGFFFFSLAMVSNDVGTYMQMLRTREQDFRTLIDRAPDAVAIVHGETVAYANAALLRVLGVDSGDRVVGRPLREMVLPDDAAAIAQLVAGDALAADPVTVRFMREDNEPAHLEVAAMSIEFDGQPARALMARDVTARQQLTARMMEMDRMISVGTLAAGVGHEINNPLSFILLNLQEAQRLMVRPDPTEADRARLQKCIDTCIDGSERIRDTVRALAYFSRQKETERAVDLAQIVESAVAIASNEIKHRARLVLELEPGIIVWANETRLGQVFINLLVNAAHAIEGGPRDENEVRVSAYLSDAHIVCEVTDTGVGIPESSQERIFEPFYTTKPAGQGTGLGLGICRETVRDMGGELSVTSRLGEGSTFRIELPRVDAVAPAEHAVRSTVPPPRRGRVLVVDDEPELLRALRRALGRYADVVTATSTDEALRFLHGKDPFDLVLSDLMMPNRSGMDLYRAVREINPELARRMIFMTGGAFTPEARAFREETDNEIMEKPVDVRRLRRHLRRALAGS